MFFLGGEDHLRSLLLPFGDIKLLSHAGQLSFICVHLRLRILR